MISDFNMLHLVAIRKGIIVVLGTCGQPFSNDVTILECRRFMSVESKS